MTSHCENLGMGRPTIQCTACSEYSHWRRECLYDNYCTMCNNHDHATHMCRAHRQAANNQGQQGQQSPQICVYCRSTEHSSSNCHRRPWDNREQPHGTPKSLRKDQQASLEIFGRWGGGNTMGRIAPMGANTQRHLPQPQSQRSMLECQEILDMITDLNNTTEITIMITGNHRGSLMQGLTKDTTRGTHPLYSHQHLH